MHKFHKAVFRFLQEPTDATLAVASSLFLEDLDMFGKEESPFATTVSGATDRERAMRTLMLLREGDRRVWAHFLVMHVGLNDDGTYGPFKDFSPFKGFLFELEKIADKISVRMDGDGEIEKFLVSFTLMAMVTKQEYEVDRSDDRILSLVELTTDSDR